MVVEVVVAAAQRNSQVRCDQSSSDTAIHLSLRGERCGTLPSEQRCQKSHDKLSEVVVVEEGGNRVEDPEKLGGGQ